MERRQLVNMVKSKIDEISSSDDLLVDVGIEDNKPVDQIIESLLDESAREILLKAPFYRLTVTSASPTPSQDSADNTIGTIAVPEGFLRLVSFRMSEWQRSVTELAIKGDAISKRQSNKHTRGGIAKPVGVLTKANNGMVIEYYSVKSQHSVKEFLYIKTDVAENISDQQMIDAMTWICAGKTLSVFEKANQANACYQFAKDLLL